jgi:site-specific recombinase XerD
VARSQALGTFFAWLTETAIIEIFHVTQDLLSAYARWLNAQSFAPATIQMKVVAVRCFFRHLADTGVMADNPAVHLRSPKLGDRLPRNILTRSQARRILSLPDTRTSKGLRDRAILELFYSTGVRCEEMARLRVDDFDPAGFIRVRGKGAKERVVPAGARACGALQEYLNVARRPWSEKTPLETALWLSAIRPHQPLTKQGIAVTTQEYARVAGLAHPGRTHIWRHTCATHLVATGANIASVQQLLGHRSLLTTQRYTRVAPVEVRKMQERCHPRAQASPDAPASIVRWR